LKRIFQKQELKELKGVDVSALLNYDKTGLSKEKLIISRICHRIRGKFYPHVENYANMTPDQVQSQFGNEFEHIGSQFAMIFRASKINAQGSVDTSKFTAAFKRHFLAMRRGD
jgi:predicted acetyltransferase